MATGKMISPNQVSVGIVSTGMYLPDRVLTATDIAEQSGLLSTFIHDIFTAANTSGKADWYNQRR